jgi:hypothetical protein
VDRSSSQLSPFIFLFALLGFGITLFITLYIQISSFTLENHGYSPSIPIFILIWMASILGLFFIWKLTVLFDTGILGVELQSAQAENFYLFGPVSLFLLTPFCLLHFLNQEDLKTRLSSLLVLTIAAVFVLKFLQMGRHVRWKELWEKRTARFLRLSRRKKLALLFCLSFVVYQACTLIVVYKGFSFSGDEPYYLMTTHSLYQDQDINVANNYDNEDYFHFYPKEFYPDIKLGKYGRFGKKGIQWIFPINQPGISVLMLPFYALGQLFKGRLLIFIIKGSLSLWAVFLGLQLFLLANDLWQRERMSLVLWFLYSFSAPILFFAFHLYPAIPIAFLSVYLFRKIREKGPLSALNYLFLGFILALFIWFGLKYNMIFFPFLLICVYFILKEHKAKWKVLAFVAFPVLSLILFYIYVHALYGTYNPIAIYEGVLTPEIVQNFKKVILNIPLLLRIDTFFDYFLDQRDGLLLYSPLYFFAFLGLIEAFRKAKKELYILLFLFLPFVLNYAFLSHRQGHSPQGRVLAPVSWILILLVGYFLVYNKKKIYTLLFWTACGVGFIIAVLCLFHPSFLYQPTTHEYTFRGGELFVHLSNLNFYLPDILPSFIKVNNLTYWPNYAWLGLILLFFLGYIKKGRERDQHNFPFHVLVVTSVLFVFIIWFSFFPRITLTWPVNVSYNSGEKITYFSLERHQQMRQQGKFLLSKDVHSYLFTFTSWRELTDIRLEFGSLEGSYRLSIRLFDQMLFEGQTDSEIKTLDVPSPPSYSYKKTNLYRMRVDLTNLSNVKTSENPYLFTIHPSD